MTTEGGTTFELSNFYFRIQLGDFVGKGNWKQHYFGIVNYYLDITNVSYRNIFPVSNWTVIISTSRRIL